MGRTEGSLGASGSRAVPGRVPAWAERRVPRTAMETMTEPTIGDYLRWVRDAAVWVLAGAVLGAVVSIAVWGRGGGYTVRQTLIFVEESVSSPTTSGSSAARIVPTAEAELLTESIGEQVARDLGADVGVAASPDDVSLRLRLDVTAPEAPIAEKASQAILDRYFQLRVSRRQAQLEPPRTSLESAVSELTARRAELDARIGATESPAPDLIVQRALIENELVTKQQELARLIAMMSDISIGVITDGSAVKAVPVAGRSPVVRGIIGAVTGVVVAALVVVAMGLLRPTIRSRADGRRCCVVPLSSTEDIKLLASFVRDLPPGPVLVASLDRSKLSDESREMLAREAQRELVFGPSPDETVKFRDALRDVAAVVLTARYGKTRRQRLDYALTFLEHIDDVILAVTNVPRVDRTVMVVPRPPS